MDPVTHLASGVIGAQAFSRNFSRARFFTLFCIICAWIPDVDVLFPGTNPEWELLHHRGLSTSFTGGAAMALLLAFSYKRINRKISFPKTYLLAFFLICVHIWLDLITSYGTQLLAPFSRERFSLDAVFIIDPILTGTLIGFIIMAFLRRSKQSIVALWGFGFVFLYPLASLGTGTLLEALVHKQYTNQGIQFEEFEFIPAPLTPCYWKIVSRQGNTYTITLANTFIPGKEYTKITGSRINPDFLSELGQQDSMFATWRWFARYPVMNSHETDNGTDVILDDLRFSSVHPIMTTLFIDREHPPFRLIGHLDSQGKLQSWEFNHSLRRRLEQAVQ